MDATSAARNTKFTHHKTDTDTLSGGFDPRRGELRCVRSRLSRRGRGAPPRPNLPGGSVHQRSIVRIGVPLAVAALALTACGSRGDSGTTSGGSTGGATKTAKIGVIAPLSGDLSALGKGIQHSVELAVKQANDTNADPGLEARGLLGRRRQAKADVGKNAATKLAADDQVVGVVGDLNSSVSQQTQPIFAAANITQVSPANTNPSLTIGADARRPRSGRTRRTSVPAPRTRSRARSPRSTSSAQGIKNVATIHDKKAYGQGLVAAFTDGVQEGRRHRRRGRDDQPRRVELPGRRVQGRAVEAAGRLLRRRVPAGRSALAADEGRRSQRPAHGWRRHLRPEVHPARRCRPATATWPPRSAPRRTARRRQEVPRRRTRRPATRSPRGLRWLLVRRGQRDHRRR